MKRMDETNAKSAVSRRLLEHTLPAWDELPDFELYMDQVTTFMDERLKNTTRNPGGDKILTKTMINNYAKNNLLPSPNKKIKV